MLQKKLTTTYDELDSNDFKFIIEPISKSLDTLKKRDRGILPFVVVAVTKFDLHPDFKKDGEDAFEHNKKLLEKLIEEKDNLKPIEAMIRGSAGKENSALIPVSVYGSYGIDDEGKMCPPKTLKSIGLAELTEKSLHKVGSVIKQAPKAADDMFKLVEKYGQPAVDFIFENGEKALKIIGRNKASIAFVAVVTYAFAHPEQVEKGIVLADNQIRDIVAKPINTIASGSVVVAKETANNLTDNWLVKLAVAIAILLVVWLLCWIGSDFYKHKMASKNQQPIIDNKQIEDNSPKPPSWEK